MNVIVRDLGITNNIQQGQNVNISVGIDNKYKPTIELCVYGRPAGNYSGEYSAGYIFRIDGTIYTYSYQKIASGNVNFAFII